MENAPHRRLAVAAALIPLAAVLVSLAFWIAARALARYPDPVRGPMYAVIASAGLAALVLVPLLLRMGRRRRIPAIVPLFVATVPWWVGLVLFFVSTHTATSALLNVSPADWATITSSAIAEALEIRMALGAFGVPLLIGTALGLALCAAARAPQKPSPVWLAVPVPGLVLVIMLARLDSGGAALFLVLPAAGFVLVSALAARFTGRDFRDEPTAPLTFSALVAGGLSVAVGIAAATSGMVSVVFLAVANVSPVDEVKILADGLAEIGALVIPARWDAAVLVGVALVLLVALALRGPSRRGAMVGGLAALGLALLVVASGPWALKSGLGTLVATHRRTVSPKVDLPRMTGHPNQLWGEPQLTLTSTSIRLRGHGTISRGALDGGTTRSQLVERLRALPTAEASRGGLRPSSPEHALAIAAGKNVNAKTLVELAPLASSAGFDALALLVRPPPPPKLRLRAYAPFIQMIQNARGTLELRLEPPKPSATSPATPGTRAQLHATVGPKGEVAVKDSAGQPASAPGDVWLSIEDGVSIQRLVNVAARLKQAHDHLFLETPPPPPMPQVSAAKLGASSPGASAARPTIFGSIDADLIRRVIHSHRDQIRYCYESRLLAHPGLHGRLTVRFIIGREGRVGTAAMVDDTVHEPALTRCVMARLKTWQFPRPKGGGVGIVTYPFAFETAN